MIGDVCLQGSATRSILSASDPSVAPDTGSNRTCRCLQTPPSASARIAKQQRSDGCEPVLPRLHILHVNSSFSVGSTVGIGTGPIHSRRLHSQTTQKSHQDQSRHRKVRRADVESHLGPTATETAAVRTAICVLRSFSSNTRTAAQVNQ